MKVTMKDIADRLDISINAVSLALNNRAGVSDAMRLKILHTADELGYLQKKAKYERTFMSANLCIMMQRIYAKDMNFYGRVLYGASEEARRYGLDALINFFDDRDMQVPKSIEEHRVSGIIVIGKINDENIRRLQAYHVPLVVVDHASLCHPLNCIVTDNKLGGFLQTQYLLEKGFEKIGFFGDLHYSLSIKERYFGFREALDSRGLPGSEDLEEYIKRYSVTASCLEQGVLDDDREAGLQLLKAAGELPEAFVCSNDKAAIYLMNLLRALHYRVPADISVVGFDDIDLAEKFTPKLTTIHVHKGSMGRRAVQRLRYLQSHKESPPETAVMGVSLIERDSVKI